MKENKNNVIRVDFGNKDGAHDDGMYIDEFMNVLVNADSDIFVGGYAADYQEFIAFDLDISLEDYYENMPEEKLMVEKIIERENGVEWHYINNDNSLLKVNDFYKIEDVINRRFQSFGIKLKRVLEVESFIILVFEECEIDTEDFSDEVEGICTEQEFIEYMNDQIFHSLSEERKEYLENLLGKRK